MVLYNFETITNPELKRITNIIHNSCRTMTDCAYEIAALITKVENDDLYAGDGFDDICDYSKRCFGFEKTTTYNLLKIGRFFIEETENGDIKTVLTHIDDKDFTVSQVIKMLPLGIDRAKELTNDGVITSDMSCRQIEKVVKQNLKRLEPKIDNEDDDPEELDDTDVIEESTLQKIRNEISAYMGGDGLFRDGIELAIKIIDKYLSMEE